MHRVLMISHSIPSFPGAGAETRAFCLTRELAKYFRITFLLPDYGEVHRSRLDALREIGEVTTFAVEKQRGPFEWRIRQALRPLAPLHPYCLLDRRPGWVRDTSELFSALRTKLDSFDQMDIDLIHFIHPHLTPSLERTEHTVPRTLDWIDERTIALERNLETNVSARARFGGMLEISRTRRFQSSIAPLFDASFVASEIDADRLQSFMGGYRPVVVPNGVELGYFCNPTPGRPNGSVLVFTGHMAYEPNVDAVLYFCRWIMPTIVAQMPGTQLFVVGTQPHPSVLALEQEYPGIVIVTGEIPDVRPYLARSIVSIVPLRSGGGTRLKILEAMAMHRPVVSTAIGCEGLVVENGRHLLIRDDPAQFAQAVIDLSNDVDRWNLLATSGRELVEQRYGWKAIARIIADTWYNVIESTRGHGVTS